MTTRPPFPHVWDSTMVGTLRACARKLELQYVQHWKPQTESIHLVAGGAFAAGIEAARESFYVKGETAADAMGRGIQALIAKYGNFQPAEGETKTLERMCGALEFYFDAYPLGNDGAQPIEYGGKHGIEFSFSNPIDVRHPVSGDPLIYAGRADMIAHAYGGQFVFDEKTTSSLGASWAKQWDMRSQFTGYTWAGKQYGIPVAGTVVRGVSILKTKYDTQQYVTYRHQWQIDRWYYQLCRDLEAAKAMWEAGYWDYNLDHSCAEYGGCAFQSICLSPEPETWLPMRFVRRVWDPIGREEVPVDEWEARWAAKEASHDTRGNT